MRQERSDRNWRSESRKWLERRTAYGHGNHQKSDRRQDSYYDVQNARCDYGGAVSNDYG